MGNIWKRENRRTMIAPLDIQLQIKLDNTQFEVGQIINGTIFINILAVQLNCQIRLTLFGIEKATYQWNEQSKKYEYTVKPNKFYKEEFELTQNSKLFADCYYYPFTIKNQIKSPSFEFQKGSLQCSIQYFLKVKVRFGDESKLNRKISEQQNISTYPSQQNLQDFDQQLRRDKSEMIASQGFFCRKSLPIFIEISTSKTYLNSSDGFQINVSIDNKFSKIKIKTIEILFCLKFIIKGKFQAMPKYIIQKEEIEELQPGEEIENRMFSFTTSPTYGLIPQSCGQKVGSRYVIILQLCFDKYFTDDVDILLPVVVNTEIEIPPYQEALETQEQLKILPFSLHPIDRNETYMNPDELYSDENRIAQKFQMIQI